MGVVIIVIFLVIINFYCCMLRYISGCGCIISGCGYLISGCGYICQGFNTELEELYKVQQQYSIPNSSLRQSVREDGVSLVILAYTPFFEL